MRVDKFIADRMAEAPGKPTVRINAYYAVNGYDLYLVDDKVCIVCGDNVALHLPQGIVYIGGENGKVLADKLAKKYPKPNAPENKS